MAVSTSATISASLTGGVGVATVGPARAGAAAVVPAQGATSAATPYVMPVSILRRE